MSDLIERLPQPALQGLRDHRGTRWLVVDLDPTRMTTLLHVDGHDETRPKPHHARQRVAAEGYMGRKRGDLMRSRMTALLSHAGMWLYSSAHPGNGQRTPGLKKVCEQLRVLGQRMPHAPPLLVRTDGEFGHAVYASTMVDSGLHYLLRCVDYGMLSRLEVQAVLAQGSRVQMQMPGSAVVREVFDVPVVLWSNKDKTVTVPTRVVVTRHLLAPDTTRPSVGHLHQGWVYELFVLDLEPSACSAAEAVSLYLGRGLLECALGQEDQELPTDRWICSEPRGQELFQRLCQWVWNHRVVLGCAMLGHVPVRHTQWTVEVTAQDPRPLVALPTGLHTSEATASEVMVAEVMLSEVMVPETTASEVTAPEATPSKGPGTPVYGAEKFVRDAQGVVQCPAGKPMRRIEVRVRVRGMRERLQSSRHDCHGCEQRLACRGTLHPFANGRTIDLPMEGPVPATATTLRATEQKGPPAPSVAPSASRRLPLWQHDILLWTELEASRMRHLVLDTLAREHFEWKDACAVAAPPTPTASPPVMISREQRARRGGTWSQLLARNECPPERSRGQVLITGVSANLAVAIGLTPQAPCVQGHPLDPVERSPGPVATA